MSVLQQKPNIIQRKLYDQLPSPIKHVLGGPENVEMTSVIMKEAGLTEEFRPYINTLVFGLFVGELDPKLLVQAVKEWLAVGDVEAQRVAGLIKKGVVEPHQDFLDSLYEKTSAQPASSSLPQSNVVNLKRS